MKKNNSIYLRDILTAIEKIERYLGTMLNIVWTTLENDLPSLKAKVAAILGSNS